MIGVVYNIRGIGNTKAQNQAMYLVISRKLNFLVILEPFVALDSYKYCKLLGMDKVVSNCNNKIWVFTDRNFVCEVIGNEEQVLNCKFSSILLPRHVHMSFGVC